MMGFCDRMYEKLTWKAPFLLLLVYAIISWRRADWIEIQPSLKTISDVAMQSREMLETEALEEQNASKTAEGGGTIYNIKQALASSEGVHYMDLWNMHTDLKNCWLRVVSEMKTLSADKATLDGVHEGYLILLDEIEHAMRASQQQREASLNELKAHVRRKIDELQHPRDCRRARLLVCDIRSKGCGFGCWLHIVINCHMAAFRDERTMIHKQDQFIYQGRWDDVYLPLTNCTVQDYDASDTRGLNPRVVVMLPTIGTKESWIHWAIPTQFAKVLPSIHGHPYAWWMSQFVTYGARLNRIMEEKILQMKTEIGFVHPIAGIQVRRSDKIKTHEARRFEVEEYMFFVEQWYRKLALREKDVQRTVYVATEDAGVLPELKRKYPRYNFISSTTNTYERYSLAGLRQIVLDIHVLSNCDYLVCAQTSNVCRTAYELMSYTQADASTNFQGLDVPYGHKIFPPKPYKVNIRHIAESARERTLERGDDFVIPRNAFQVVNDGYLRGELETGGKLKIPAYKARAKLLLTNYSILQ